MHRLEEGRLGGIVFCARALAVMCPGTSGAAMSSGDATSSEGTKEVDEKGDWGGERGGGGGTGVNGVTSELAVSGLGKAG